jgi:23S rRNA G2069 N7-methylase RlmK/C1962 C5-methylase RlmI
MKMYNYQTEKSEIFTEDGQKTFLKIRDKVQQLLKQSGAVMMQNAISGVTGDSWLHLACVDRLVELKEIQEITKENVAGQHRVFVAVS